MSLTKDVLSMTYINKVNCCDLYTCVTCASLICLNCYIKDVYIVPSIPPIRFTNRRKVLKFNRIQDFFILPTPAKNPIKTQIKKVNPCDFKNFIVAYSL